MPRFIGKVGQVMLMALVGALAARAAPPGDSVSAPLQSVPLDGTGAVVSKSDAAGSDARIINGILLPNLHVEFGPVVKEYGLKIAGRKVAIISTGSGFAVKGDSGQTPLHQNGMGLATMGLPIPGAQEYFLGIPYAMNSWGRGYMALRCGGTLQCNIDGQSVMFYDDNLDGRYTVSDDAFRVGGADAPIDVFAPMSRFFSTGPSIYQIDNLAEDGTVLQYSPYHGAVGKLAIDCPSPDFGMLVVLANDSGQMNLVSSANSAADPLAVIPGQYKLLYGGVYCRKSGALAAIVRPGSLPALDVAANQTQTLQLGGTLHLEFTVNKQWFGKISIDPSSFHVKGKGGEEYASVNFDRCNPPEIFVSRGDKTKSLGKMGFS